MNLFKLIMVWFFSGFFKFGARFVSVGLFTGFYFTRYMPTNDLLMVLSFFLSTFGLWKLFDFLDSKTDGLVKWFEEKIDKRE